jgi:hypothetical protein
MLRQRDAAACAAQAELIQWAWKSTLPAKTSELSDFFDSSVRGRRIGS